MERGKESSREPREERREAGEAATNLWKRGERLVKYQQAQGREESWCRSIWRC